MSTPKVTVRQVIDAVERHAPLNLQESWDNSGLQVGHSDTAVSGVLVTVDVTPERIDEAVAAGANMIVSHHPLIFKGLKSITGQTRTQQAVEKAIRNDISVYSAHTSLDNAADGLSVAFARHIGASVVEPLVPSSPGAATGCGVICELPEAMSPNILCEAVRRAFGISSVRHSEAALRPETIRRIAVCTGAGGSLIDEAVRHHADAYITGEIRYHDFIDFADKIFLIECGHFETEEIAKDVLTAFITEAFPYLSVLKSKNEKNPVIYIN